MEERLKFTLTLVGISIVAYSIGYHQAQKRIVTDLGAAATKEAMMYLATQDHLRRFGR